MPAEDILTYKVEVDATDLPQQLEQLRSQMDMALGAMAFGNAPAPPEMTSGPLNFMFNAAPDVGHQQMINASTNGFLATQQAMTQAEGSGLMSFLNTNVEAFRLGYSKFHTGMERMGLMVPPSPLVQFPMQGMTAYGEQAQHLQQLGLPGGPFFTATGMEQAAAHMPGLIPGVLGMGYDPDTMPMTRFEFQEAYGGAAAKRTRDFLEGNAGALGGAAAGAVIGAFGGPLGVIGGATIGMAFDMTVGLAGAQRRQEEQVGKALQRISQRSGMQKGFTAEEGADLAGDILSQADTYESRINRVTRESIQSQLLDFTTAGGFDNTATAEEFKATAQGVIENTRKIMQTLRMTQEEATTFMAEMNRDNLVSTQDAGGFAMSVAANARVAGLDPTMMLNEMRAGAEMFRGSTYEMGGGMQMLMDARLTTQQMLQTTPGGADIIRELGGMQQASMGLAQLNANFMQTGMGMLAYNNAQAGGAGNDTLAMLGNAAGMSPFDWYAQRARMSQDVASGEISQQDIAGFRLDPIMDMYSRQFKRTEGRGMGVDDFEGFFQFLTQSGFSGSVAEAKQTFAIRFADPEEGTQRNIQALNAQLDKMRQPEPVSILQKISADIGGFLHEAAAPFREAEERWHDSWDAVERGVGDWYLDRERFVMDNTTTTDNELQAAIAQRSGKGQLQANESAFLTRIKQQYLTHVETTGELSEDRYLKTVLTDESDSKASVDAAWRRREDIIKSAVIDEIPAQFLYGDDAPTGLVDPSILKTGYTAPTNYSSYAGNAPIAELLTRPVDYFAGIDISPLEAVLGEDFEWGKISSDFSLSTRGTSYIELTGGKGWGNVNVSGVDSFIIAMMQAEGTLTAEGALGNVSGLTRGNHNSNPINIRAPHTKDHDRLVQAHQREQMGMDANSAGWGNLGPATLKSMRDMGNYDPESFYSLDVAQRYWDGAEGIDDKGFVKFDDYESGITAARQQVLSAVVRGDTINEYLTRHAPGFENDVSSVINTVMMSHYQQTGDKGMPGTTATYMANQDLNTVNIQTWDTDSNAYDLAAAIDPANADRTAVERFQRLYMDLPVDDPGFGTLGVETSKRYQEVMALGRDAFISDFIPNAYDLATAIDPANADRNAVARFQRLYMDLPEDDPGLGTLGVKTTEAWQEVIGLGRDAYTVGMIDVNTNQANATDNVLQIISQAALSYGLNKDPLMTGKDIVTVLPSEMTATDDVLQIISQAASSYGLNKDLLMTGKDIVTVPGKGPTSRILTSADIAALTAEAAAGGETEAVTADYVKTLTAMFHGDDAAAQAGLLTSFIVSMGGTEANQGSLTGSLVELGLVNVSSDPATQIAESLFLEGKAMDMYSTFMLPTHSEMRIKGMDLRNDLVKFKVVTDNQEALSNLQTNFEGAQISALNTATEIMLNNGLLTNAVDVNEDGTINFTDLQGTDMSSVRDFLYVSNQQAYQDLFMNQEGSTSVAADVIRGGGKDAYRKMMTGDFYAKGTKSFDAQALEWFIDDTEKLISTQTEKYALDPAGKKTLLDKVEWGSTENLENVDISIWNKIISGIAIVGGVAAAPFTGGQSLWVSAAGIAGLSGEVLYDTITDASATNVGKLLNLALAEDSSTFNSKYQQMEDLDFTDFTGDKQLEIFKKMVLSNDMEFDNKFISQLRTIEGQSLEGQALWDAGTRNYINQSIAVAEDLRDQNQAGIDQKAGYGVMLKELDLAKGIRAGILDRQTYTKFGGAKAGTPLSTFDRVQNIKAQLTEEREQLVIDKGTGEYLADILKDVSRGVNAQNYRQGEGDPESETYIESYKEWTGRTTGQIKEYTGTKDQEYEDYVFKTRLTQGSVNYGGAFLDALTDIEGTGIYDKAKRTQDDERALETQRKKNLSGTFSLTAEDEQTNWNGMLNRQDIVISKLEQLIRKT